MAAERLPRVSVNVAITADGKIAPADRHFKPFTTPRDHELMMELRSRVDAVMCGARTVDLAKVDLGPGGKKYEEQRLRNGLARFNLRVIASGTASVNPKSHIFTQRFSPIILLTSGQAPTENVRRLSSLVDDVHVSPGSKVEMRAALGWLREKWKVARLLCEGGGEINAALFEERLVDEVYVTIAPVLFGGRGAPTLCDGDGVSRLSDGIQLQAKRLERVGDEMYCVYSFAKRAAIPKKQRRAPMRQVPGRAG